MQIYSFQITDLLSIYPFTEVLIIKETILNSSCDSSYFYNGTLFISNHWYTRVNLGEKMERAKYTDYDSILVFSG